MTLAEAPLNPDNTSVQAGSDNVFADLALPDAEECLIKAKLIMKIDSIIKARGLKQVEAAELLGITPQKISALLKGKLGLFSFGSLIRFLNTFDTHVDIVFPEELTNASFALEALQGRAKAG